MRQSRLLPADNEAAPSLPGIFLWAKPFARSPRAVLYRGWDRSRRRRVLVKVPRAADDPIAVCRFGREGAVLLRLRHPSIVKLYTFHPSSPAKNEPAKSDPAALVMEYVPGVTLEARVAAGGWLPPARAVQIVEEIAAALDCVHALGVVHRDIKPSNIILPWRGPAKLTDFGVARLDEDLPLTVMGDILGTIEYASPEQVHGNEAVGDRSDVYSLAAVTYFALTATPPFRAADASTQSQLSVMHRQVFSHPPPLRFHRPDLAPAIEDAVLRGLAKSPEARYATAGQFAAVLRAALAASEGEPQQKAKEASARRTGILAGAAAGAVLLAGFAFWAAVKPRPTVPGPAVAALPRNSSYAAVPQPAASAAVDGVPKRFPVKYAPVKISPVRAARTAPAKPALVKTASLKTAPAKTAMVTAKPQAVRTVHLPQPRHYPPVSPQPPQKFLRAAAAVPLHHLPLPAKAKTAASRPAAAARAGWYTVSGWIALPSQSDQNQPGQKPQLVRASPIWVQVDGHPLPQLGSGEWTILPAGTHRITFQPQAGMGVGPKTWTVKIAPSAHLSQQVPLPPAPLPDIPTHLRNP